MFDLDLKDEANPLKTWPWPSSQIRANLAGLGICSSVFWANRLFFAKKWADERFAYKNEQLAHLLIFCERPEGFAHGRSFLVSNLSNSLTSLVKKEGMSKSLGGFFNVQNMIPNCRKKSQNMLTTKIWHWLSGREGSKFLSPFIRYLWHHFSEFTTIFICYNRKTIW